MVFELSALRSAVLSYFPNKETETQVTYGPSASEGAGPGWRPRWLTLASLSSTTPHLRCLPPSRGCLSPHTNNPGGHLLLPGCPDGCFSPPFKQKCLQGLPLIAVCRILSLPNHSLQPILVPQKLFCRYYCSTIVLPQVPPRI